MDSVFELLLLLLIGGMVGAFADSSRRARAQAAESGRLAALGETGLALMAQTEGPLAAIKGQAESLAGLADSSRQGAILFASQAICDEVARARRLILDLGEIARVTEHRSDRIDLGPLVAGIVQDASRARSDGRRALLIRSAQGCCVEADRRALAFSLRALVFGLLDIVPAPGWLELRLDQSFPGEATVELSVFSLGVVLPDLEESLTRVFRPGSGQYRFRQVLCIRLLASLGATVRFHPVSPCHTRILVGFRATPAQSNRAQHTRPRESRRVHLMSGR